MKATKLKELTTLVVRSIDVLADYYPYLNDKDKIELYNATQRFAELIVTQEQSSHRPSLEVH